MLAFFFVLQMNKENFNEKKSLISISLKNNLKSGLYTKYNCKWRPPSQSKLTPMIFNTWLTQLGWEASKYLFNKCQ